MNWQSKLVRPYEVKQGKGFRLKDFDPSDTADLSSKEDASEMLAKGVTRLEELQQKLYADNRWGVLLIFQAMDAAGKDSVIKHVMSGVNPQGCQVYSFKAPSAEDLDHDYLWRTSRCLPERGRIGIFNRSYYEEVLVVRVHPQILANEKVPPQQISKTIWKDRFQDIHAFERYLWRNGILVLKFYLNVSRKEQKKRFLERLDQPDKHWKFSIADLHERDYWDEYMDAYQDAIRHTASKHSPWYVVPADNKWFTRVVVAAAIVDALEGLKLEYPTLDSKAKKELADARAKLLK